MSLEGSKRICVVPRVQGVGGMVSFQRKLVQGLSRRGVQTCFDLADKPYQVVLVIGGTRQLGGLWRARRGGIPVVQRLDGMNWLHRLGQGKGASVGLRHWLRAEYGNFILSLIRRRLASGVVYQSLFVRGWWERVYGSAAAAHAVIHNGVDLDVYSPAGEPARPPDVYRLLMVEGSLMGGYEQGLEAAAQLAVGVARRLQAAHSQEMTRRSVELVVAGRTPPELQEYWEQRLAGLASSGQVKLSWAGLVSPERIPELDRSAHLLYSSDINAACPNSVIEALACGLPVLAFDTGALPELVTGDAGRVVPYGGDPWRLDPPDIDALALAALEILQNQGRFRAGARQRAEQAFGLEAMLDAYLDFLLRSA